MALRIRFDYGSIVPWVRSAPREVRAAAGADALILRAGVSTRRQGQSAVADFEASEGQRVPFERELLHEGFVRRYRSGHDALPGPEGVFLACSFSLADCYALMGRAAEAKALFERLLALRNDVGLLSEEYDPTAKRLLGNFPQAFSHLALVGTAFNVTPGHRGPAQHRSS